MSTLIEWLRAQLDEDERSIEIWGGACAHIEACGETGDFLDRFDVDRMLADVKAKRAVLDEAEQESRNAKDRLRFGDHPGYAGAILDRCIKNLAQPYAGRDGWQPEWNISD
ncbi:MAG TPA: DUF6221 family protein [Candidatus Limnocylindria bacterium]